MKNFKTKNGNVQVSKGKNAPNFVLPVGFTGNDLVKFTEEHKEEIADIQDESDHYGGQ